MSKRGTTVSDYLPWVLIAIAILVILLFFDNTLREKALLAIQKIMSAFRG